MKHTILAVVLVFCLTGCIQTQVKYGELELKTTRVFNDTEVGDLTAKGKDGSELSLGRYNAKTSPEIEAFVGITKALMQRQDQFVDRLIALPRTPDLFNDTPLPDPADREDPVPLDHPPVPE